MKTLSIGKFRRLSQCLTETGAISILALDHRNNLRNALNPQHPEEVTAAMLVEFKEDVVRSLASASSALLLDPQFGAAQTIASGALPGRTGLAVSLEATGYTGDPLARESGILAGFSVEKIVAMNASAVKFLAYYHPDSPTAADIEQLVRQIGTQCAARQIPFFLEALSYSLDPQNKKLKPEERKYVVLETARRLVSDNVDVFKAEFPLDINAEGDYNAWEKACADLSDASSAPWVLLSASVDYETFLRQVTAACNGGSSGVAVGRAVWKEAVGLEPEQRREFLNRVARQRMERVTALVNALAKPVSNWYTAEQANENWFAG